MYDPVLLRTFLAVAGAAGFTSAGAQLGLSQPTVSQHIRRLEESVGRPLLVRDTRDVRLTDAGEAMAGFARSILAAHATAERYFDTAATKGRLRFGAADDLAITQLPRILRHFRQLNPQVNLELTVGQSPVLSRRLAAGGLDLVFIKQSPGEVGEGRLVLRDTFVWVGQESTPVAPDEPVPLVTYRSPSLSRSMALAALDAHGRRWRIACTVRDVSALIAAVRAGLGVAVFPHSLIPSDLTKVSVRFALPDLDAVDFRLLANPAAPVEAVQALSAAISAKTFGPAGAPAS
ncbi:LysR substrate-binding domain-containing protein [uncultured Amnibacterium sp.]|uniref:LysR substrate-binding domain-containing protein n=1 Tax=uncultured Amnibacterium sp. TaxID=1631851 RepID=UPI0035CB4755